MKTYLSCYYQWMTNGQRLPDYGLCWCFGHYHYSDDWRPREGREDFALFIPSDLDGEYWADDGSGDSMEATFRYFNPLRQNIVLLLAAMNGEL